jgi:hypothetical protein
MTVSAGEKKSNYKSTQLDFSDENLIYPISLLTPLARGRETERERERERKRESSLEQISHLENQKR